MRFTRPVIGFCSVQAAHESSNRSCALLLSSSAAQFLPWSLACTNLPCAIAMLKNVACTAHNCAHTFSHCAKRLHSFRARLSGPQQASAPLAAGFKLRSGLSFATKGPATRGMAAAAAPGASEPAAAAADLGSNSGGGPAPADPLLQYVVLRRDLWTELDWPLGSVVAQGCHAATAALWGSRDTAATQEYCAPQNIDHMHKVRRAQQGRDAAGCKGRGPRPPIVRCRTGRRMRAGSALAAVLLRRCVRSAARPGISQAQRQAG